LTMQNSLSVLPRHALFLGTPLWRFPSHALFQELHVLGPPHLLLEEVDRTQFPHLLVGRIR
jgi:hypothetical protein